MKIKFMIYNIARYLFVILGLTTIFACNNDNLKKGNKEPNKESEIQITEKPVDTSYKKNIRLFDQFYYDMPKSVVESVNAEIVKKIESDHAILTYKNENIYFEKQFYYEADLLKNIKLVANNVTNNRENSPLVLSLLISKYGKSNFKEDKYESDETQIIATRIIDYKRSGFSESTNYDSKIHRKINKNEFNEFIDNEFQSSFYSVANNELQIVSLGEDSFYRIMKDVTKDEFVKIPVEVAIKKIPYKKIVIYNDHTWKDGEKYIRLYCFESVKYIGNKYKPLEMGINTNIILTYGKLEKNSNEKDTEIPVDTKLKEKETMNAI